MPWFNIIFCILCWGIWGTAEKLSIQNIPPLSSQIIGMGTTALCIPFMLMYVWHTAAPLPINLKGAAWAVVASIMGMAATVSLLQAVQKHDGHLVIGLTAAYPAVTAILCAVFLGEHVTLVRGIGIVVIFIGTVLVGM